MSTRRFETFPRLAATLVAIFPAAAAFTAAASAQALPAGVTQGATVEGITEYSLDNGLRFLLFPDQGKQQVTVNITYLVGSRHEAYGETGMAHLLEHLVFKGTPDHPDIPAELTEHGAFPNGTTWFDRTNYFETFPASEENLTWALDLEADRMVNSYIAAEDLESEMTVVRNEWESGENNPGGVLQKRIMSAAYDWHNYGNSTIGARADIENVPIDRLQAFYRKYYQPDNAVLVVAGRFDRALALELVADLFGEIPAPDRSGANQLFTTYTAEPAQDGEHSVTLRRVGDQQIVTAAYHMPPGSHEQFAAVDVMTHVLSARPSGRLYQALVEPGLAASTFAVTFQLKEPGLLLASARVREGDSLDAASEALLATLDEMAEGPPTQEEVDRAKTDFLSGIQLQFNNPQGIALQLSEWASMGDWRLLFLHRDRIEQVTPEAVYRVAQTYLKPSNRTIGYFLPTDETPARAEVPAPPDVAALVAGYTGRDAVAEGEAFEPTPENIDARTSSFDLASGMEVAFLPKQNRGEAVTVTIQLRMGSEQALMGKATAGSLAGAMLMRGTTTRSRQGISDELDRLKAQGGLGGSATITTGSFTTVRENLPAVLRLAGDILHNPVFDPDEFAQLVEQRLAGIEAQRSEPQALVAEALGRHMSPWPPDHPLYAPTFDEQIALLEAATVEDSRAFWEAFSGAQGGTMSVVGDFDPAEIRPVVEEIFGSWTARESYARIDRPFREVAGITEDIETPDKANAMMIAVLPLPMRDDDPDYAALVIANEILGGGFLNSRLATRIRQQEGLSYGVGSQFSAHPRDEQGQLIAFAIFAPENGDKVVTAFREEIAKVLDAGFTAEEVDAAQRGYLDQAKNQRANDGTIAQMLAVNLFWDRSLAFTAEHEAAVAALTPERIIAAVRRHLDPDKISIFRGGDFANKLVP